MKLLAHIAATVLGVNLGILAAAVTAAYREHERHLTDAAWDAHVGDALAVAQSADERTYHAVVSAFAERMAEARAAEYAAEDFAEWDRELMFEEGR